MRTTLNIDAGIMTEYKKLAAETHRTLSYVVQDALREMLLRREEAAARPRVQLPTFGGGGLQPGVDLDNNAAVTELLEADRDETLRRRFRGEE